MEQGRPDVRDPVQVTGATQSLVHNSLTVMAGLVPAIHVFLVVRPPRRGCPGHPSTRTLRRVFSAGPPKPWRRRKPGHDEPVIRHAPARLDATSAISSSP